MTCRDELQKLYPADTNIIKISGSSKANHRCTLRLKCRTKEEFVEWLHAHQSLSGFTFRVLCVKPRVGITVIYKATYRCHHNTHPSKKVKNPSKKHTGCKAKLTVIVKSSPKDRRVRSKDELRAEYPTIVNVVHEHNHLIDVPEVTIYKDPTEETKTKFLDLLGHHGPAKSLSLHKHSLLKEYKDDYFKVAADRSLCPDIKWVNRLYNINFRTNIRQFFDDVQYEMKWNDVDQSSTEIREISNDVKTELNIIDVNQSSTEIREISDDVKTEMNIIDVNQSSTEIREISDDVKTELNHHDVDQSRTEFRVLSDDVDTEMNHHDIDQSRTEFRELSDDVDTEMNYHNVDQPRTEFRELSDDVDTEMNYHNVDQSRTEFREIYDIVQTKMNHNDVDQTRTELREISDDVHTEMNHHDIDQYRTEFREFSDDVGSEMKHHDVDQSDRVPQCSMNNANANHMTSEDVHNIFKDCCERVQNYLQQNPERISAAIDKFHATFMSLNTENHLTSALHNFGKAIHSSIKIKKNPTFRPFQPTAISSRKCGISSSLQSDRLAREGLVGEHAYSMIEGEMYMDKTPHCMNECLLMILPPETLKKD